MSKHSKYDAAYFDREIIRCHRGPYNPGKSGPRPIFCRFNYRTAEVVRELFKFKNYDGVSIRDQFSDATQERVNRALLFRKDLKRSEGNDTKIFIAYPARVMMKRPGELKYTNVKSF